MYPNRDEVLEKALRIFAKMNYEKASQMEIARTCGLSKAGLTYYFPFKQDLFTAVADRYVFDTQHSKNKFNFTAGSLSEFIDRYVAGVENTMQRLVRLLDDGNNPNGCSFNFYYYHLLHFFRYGSHPRTQEHQKPEYGATKREGRRTNQTRNIPISY